MKARPAPDALKAQADAILRAAGFRDAEAAVGAANPSGLRRPADPDRAEYLRRAHDYLASAPFPTDFERRVWEGHADGVSARQLAKLLGSYRKKVDQVIARHDAALKGKLLRPRGRPPEPHARGDGAYQTNPVRLSPSETEALLFLVRQLGQPENEVVRLCIRAQAVIVAERISGTGKSGAK